MKKLLNLAVLFLACFGTSWATDPTCNISFTVTREVNGKPVRNAEIVLHPVDKNGRQRPNGVELKADAEGKASYTGLPYGKIRVQVIAPGLQTFGEDYEIKEQSRVIEVKLKRPQSQYSIYEDKDKKDKEKDPHK